MDMFMTNALILGICFSVLAGPIGSVMVWKRLSFFGDTIAHSTLLGVAISMMTNLSIIYVLLVLCIALALFMTFTIGYDQEKSQPNDAKLAMLSHGSLALGILALSFHKAPLSEFNALLFGDILSIDSFDLMSLGGLVIIVLLALRSVWKPFLTLILSPEIALSEDKTYGRQATLLKIGFASTLGLTIGLTLKVVGALLMTALLIIPPLTARRFAKSPLQMMVIASGFCIVSFLGGLSFSFLVDTPSGPSIVATALMLYAISLIPALSRR